MGCGVYKAKATTIGQAHRQSGMAPLCNGDPNCKQCKEIISGGETWFICGGPEVPACQCGHLSDLLCDFPMGKRVRCDLALCEDCAHEIGKNRHLCDIHFEMFKGAAKSDEIEPPPPSGPWTPTIVQPDPAHGGRTTR